MTGQPSSPGIWVSELRFGGARLNTGEATFCIDIADKLRQIAGSDRFRNQNSLLPARRKDCRLHGAKLRRSGSRPDCRKITINEKSGAAAPPYAFCFAASFC